MCYIVFISRNLHWCYIKIALQEYVIFKFKIFPTFWEGRGANLGKCWKNVKIIGFFIFSGISLNSEIVASIKRVLNM